MSIDNSHKISDVKVMLKVGADGAGISSIEKTGTSGLVDTYTITLSTGAKYTFTVTNGKSIDNIAKTGTTGLVDTYTITYNDSTTSTFTITNGNGISDISKTSTAGLVDTYTITFTNGDTSTFTVTNGGGSTLGSLSDVDITTPTDGQLLIYNNGVWENVDAPASSPNPNLLMNPWFTINQRGATSGTFPANTFFVDRWRSYTTASNGTWTLNTDGLLLDATSEVINMQQFFESTLASGKTYTISVLLNDGTIYSGTVENMTAQDALFINESNIQVIFNLLRVRIIIPQSYSITIRAIKLELGSTSTLALDTTPDYTTELLKCQRYFRRIGSVTNNGVVAMAFSSTATNGYALIPLSVPMRTLPTVTVSGNYSFGTYAFAYYTVTVSANSASDYRDRLLLNLVGTNLPTNTSGILVSGATSYIDLSAEL